MGVYYLFGSNEDETPQCYIGQSGNVGLRLKQHTATKDFWTKAMVAVSLTNEWTATHVAYLEWLSVARATSTGRYVLVNGNQASNPFTPEALEADCQEFLETVAVLLATLGAPVLESVQRVSARSSADADEAPERLHFRDPGCEATGYQTAEGLLVLAGSKGRATVSAKSAPRIARQREALSAEGVIQINETELVFLKDHLFPSPSAAGCVIIGCSNNGRASWRNAEGKSLNDLEAETLAATNELTP